MNAPVQLRELMAQWVDSLNPEAEIRYRQALAREAEQRGYERGHGDGYAAACTDVKAAEHAIHRVLKRHHEVSEKRWHLCCPSCRLKGHRPNCKDCEQRTQETFAEPHPLDTFRGQNGEP